MIISNGPLMLEYRKFFPAGFTDELGLISDRNQYVPEQKEGWYILGSVTPEVHNWCKNRLSSYHFSRSYKIIKNEKEVIMFILRWMK